jgi:hypothetical protein
VKKNWWTIILKCYATSLGFRHLINFLAMQRNLKPR